MEEERLIDMNRIIVALTIASLFIPTVVYSQQLPAEFILRVKPVDLDKIGRGLGKLPFDDVVELIQSLRSQVIEQQTKANSPVDNSKKEPDK